MESVPDSPAARKVGDFANAQVNNFLNSVEDLTNALKDVESPEIARVRTKVKLALVAARSAASDTASQIRSQAQQVGQRTDTFVRDNPWQVIGIAAVAGLRPGRSPSRGSCRAFEGGPRDPGTKRARLGSRRRPSSRPPLRRRCTHPAARPGR